MRLMDLDTGREYVPIWIDGNNNLVVTTELIHSHQIDGVIVLHPCGMGTMFKRLLSTKTQEGAE